MCVCVVYPTYMAKSTYKSTTLPYCAIQLHNVSFSGAFSRLNGVPTTARPLGVHLWSTQDSRWSSEELASWQVKCSGLPMILDVYAFLFLGQNYPCASMFRFRYNYLISHTLLIQRVPKSHRKSVEDNEPPGKLVSGTFRKHNKKY